MLKGNTMAEPAKKQDNIITLEDLRPRRKERSYLADYVMPARHPNILFDPGKCTGCGTCEMVCSLRNRSVIAPASSSIKMLRDGEKGKNFAIYCQHCRKPLCIEACPTRAIEKDENGIVSINKLFCVECGLCTLACPESAPLRDSKTGEINKCDLCGGDPLCVKHCPEKALTLTRGKFFRWIKAARWTVQAVSFLLLVMIFVGTFCFFKAGQVSFACPTGMLQNIAASKTIVLTTLSATLALIVLTILLGRVFCGWICPFGFVLDVIGTLIPKKLGWPRFLKSRLTKYGILGGAVGASAALGFQSFCVVCPIGTLCRSYGAQGFMRGAELAVVPLLASTEIAQRRAWCRYFCPVGAVLALLTKLGLLKIVIGATSCKKFSCTQCADVCPMGIIDRDLLRQGISPKIPMSECIMCMRCIDRCPYGAAKIRFRWQKGVPGIPGETRI